MEEKLYLWGMETEEDGPEVLQAAKGEGDSDASLLEKLVPVFAF